MKYSFLMPTRRRVKSCIQSIDSIHNYSDNKNIFEILLAFDEDDDTSHEILDHCVAFKIHHQSITTKRYGYERLHAYYNKLSKIALGSHLWLWNDDALLETPHWDTIMDQHISESPDLVFDFTNGYPFILPLVPKKYVDKMKHFSLNAHCDSWIENVMKPLHLTTIIPEIRTFHNRHAQGNIMEINYDEVNKSISQSSPEFFTEFSNVLRQVDQNRIRRSLPHVFNKNLNETQLDIISVLVPTRNRPTFMKELVRTCLDTSDHPELIEFVFYIDDDDEKSYECVNQLIDQGFNIKYIRGARIVLSNMWNNCFEICTGNILMHCGDDIRFRTNSWDTTVRNKFMDYPDRILFVFGYDGVHRKGSFGTHGFLHRRWVEAIGYFVPPYFSSDFNDTWLNDVAKMIGRWAFIDIYTEHMHPCVNKHTWDSTHQERIARHNRDGVDEIYASKYQDRAADAQKLKDVISRCKTADPMQTSVVKEETNNVSRRIGFVGMGKLGLPVSIGMANKGHLVMGYDINPLYDEYTRVSEVFTEHEAGPDGTGEIGSLLDHPNLKLTKDLELVVEFSEIIFIAVQTPHDPLYEGITRVPDSVCNFNYTYLKQAIDEVAGICDRLQLKRTLVVISTVLPGTMKSILPKSEYASFCYNPYFIAMGTVLNDFYNPEFILLGGNDMESKNKVIAFYKTITPRPVFQTSVESAELIKVSYNTMISMKLAFVNQLMEICDHIPGANIDDVTDALKLANKRLISPAYMTAGMGDGGGCHPRDNIAMSWLAKELGLKTDFCAFIMKAREKQTEFLSDLCIKHATRTGMKIVILGKAFKPNIRLTTGSPSILLYNLVRETDETVEIHEDLPSNIGKSVFFIGTKHDRYARLEFPEGSVVIDPNRYIPKHSKYNVYHVGRHE